jgi:hypothetical protein
MRNFMSPGNCAESAVACLNMPFQHSGGRVENYEKPNQNTGLQVQTETSGIQNMKEEWWSQYSVTTKTSERFK